MRFAADVVGVYGLVWMLGMAASLTVHPHLVTDAGLRVRSGAHVDVTVPWHAVDSVAVHERSRDSSRAVQVDRDGDRVTVSVVSGSRTNVDVRLREPLAIPVRSGEERVTEIRLFADDPRGLTALVRTSCARR